MIQIYHIGGQRPFLTVHKYTYSGVHNGERKITFSVSSPTPIDWQVGDYFMFRNERFELRYAVAVTKKARSMSVGDAFVYDSMVFYSESERLTAIDFLDVVLNDNNVHYSSLPNFSFFCETVQQLADRIKANLNRVYPGKAERWTVTVASGTTMKPQELSFNSQKVSQVLSGTVNGTLKLNYYVRGRVITIGGAGVDVNRDFYYGKGNGLKELKVSPVDNAAVVNRLRAYGSQKNLPYRYYNKLYRNTETGDIEYFRNGAEEGWEPVVSESMYVPNLMLPSFVDDGVNTYIEDQNSIDGYGLREGTVFFDGTGEKEDIFPTIENMTAARLIAAGYSIYVAQGDNGNLDEIVSATQIEDNGLLPEDGSDLRPATFNIRIKDIGFDINDWLTEETAQIYLRDGWCGGRSFDISGVTAVVENNVTIAYDLTCIRTKDDTIGYAYPNNPYQISARDKFSLLNIAMPKAYVDAASQYLLEQAQIYLETNKEPAKNFSPELDNKELMLNPSTANRIVEGNTLTFHDNDLNITATITISELTIKVGEDTEVPVYELTLSDDITPSLADRINQSVNDSMKNGGLYKTINDTIANSNNFLSKVKEDTAQKKIRFYGGLETGIYDTGIRGGKIDEGGNAELGNIVVRNEIKSLNFNPDPLTGVGFGIYKDSQLNNATKAVVDYLTVRKGMQVAVLEIAEYKSVNGGLVLSPANGVIESVEYTDDGTIYSIKIKERNQFTVGDLIRCQTWDMDINPTSPLRYYWVEVQYSGGLYIEVNKADFPGGVIPQAEDVLVLMGSTINAARQGFSIIIDDGISVYSGVDSTDLTGKLRTKLGDLNSIAWHGRTLSGYGLLADSVYLSGTFLLENTSGGTTTYVDVSEGFHSVVTTLQEGGVNFARRTNQGTTGWGVVAPSGITINIVPYQADYVRFTGDSWQVMSSGNIQLYLTFPFIKNIAAGTKATLSFDVDYDDSNVATKFYARFRARMNGSYTSIWTTSENESISYSNDGWQHFEFTKNVTVASVSPDMGQVVIVFKGKINDVKIRNIKFELGEIATSYTAAPEDTTDAVSEVRSEITQTAEEISMSVVESVVNGESENLFVTPFADFTLNRDPNWPASNGFFNPLSAFAISEHLTHGEYYTLVMRVKLGTAWTGFQVAPESYSYTSFELTAEEKGDWATITRTFCHAVTSPSFQSVYIRLTGAEVTDAHTEAELQSIYLYKGDGVVGSLKRTGIDIKTGLIVLQADTVKVKDTNGDEALIFNATDGTLRTNLIRVSELDATKIDTNHLIARDSNNYVKATVNADFVNGTLKQTNDGAYRIYYPSSGSQNTAKKLELLDVNRGTPQDPYWTTLRMFESDGQTIAWELGTDAMAVGFTNPTIVMLDLSDASDPEAVGDLPSQRYAFHTDTNVIEGGVAGQTYYSKTYEAEKNPSGYIVGTTKYIRKQYTDANSEGVWTISDYVWYIDPLQSGQRIN